ncbi:MAG: hypothetical protein HYR56_26625 [Acidobacteria bacterium]|nr:hypothetical protein [Acidobacteriota bacterium]MBI3428120.1 hypothetical protein [Acidobacteriota bacterium]
MKSQHEAPKCERKEELVEYLYDEMPFQRRALFADHLTACASCSADLVGMERLRGELRVWDVQTVPRMELVIPRSKLDVLKELLGLFPLWSRAMLATAGAVATILIALGTLSLFRQTNAVPDKMAGGATPAPLNVQLVAPPQITTPAALSPAEIKTLVGAEVAKALEQERQTLRTQMAALDARNQEQRAQLQTLTHQLRALNVRHQEMLAAQQPSIRSIFAEAEPNSER